MNIILSLILIVFCSVAGTLWLATRVLGDRVMPPKPDPALDAWRAENLRKADEAYYAPMRSRHRRARQAASWPTGPRPAA